MYGSVTRRNALNIANGKSGIGRKKKGGLKMSPEKLAYLKELVKKPDMFAKVWTEGEPTVCILCQKVIYLGEKYRESGGWHLHESCYKEHRAKHLQSD